MTILFLGVLTALTLISLLCNKRRIAVFFTCFSLFSFWMFWAGFLTEAALAPLQSHSYLERPEWKKTNVIVILGFGSVRWPSGNHVSSQALEYTRLYEGTRLYRQCRASSPGAICRVLVTGGDPLGLGVPEAVTMAAELEATGVEKADLVIEPASRNTFQNAKFSAPLIEAGGFEQKVLVTSATHMTRAQLFFSHFGVHALSAPSNHLNALRTLSTASRNFFLLDVALHEYGGILQYHWYNFMGWNPPVKK